MPVKSSNSAVRSHHQIPKALCLLRLSALGDVTHVVPLVNQLHRHWPDTRLTWICGSLERRLLEGVSGVQLQVFDKASGLKGLLALRRKLASQRFDILLHLAVAMRANLVSLCVKAPLRVGYDRARSRDLHGLFINQRIAARQGQHVQDAILSFADVLGLPAEPPQWNIPISDREHEGAASLMPGQQPSLLISPCSSHQLRNWSVQRYARVAEHATARGFRVVLVGGPSDIERQHAEGIAALCRAPLLNLVGKDTLKQFLALCMRAHALLTPDSGPMHMANATGLPVIGLHAASNPRRSGPYNTLQWCVDRYDAASRRYRGVPAHTLRWGSKLEYPGVMDLIETEDVCERIDALLDAGGLERRLSTLPAPCG